MYDYDACSQFNDRWSFLIYKAIEDCIWRYCMRSIRATTHTNKGDSWKQHCQNNSKNYHTIFIVNRLIFDNIALQLFITLRCESIWKQTKALFFLTLSLQKLNL